MRAGESGSRGGPWSANVAGAGALGAAFDGLSAPIAVLDHEGRMLRLNGAARQLSPDESAPVVGEYLCGAPWWADDTDRTAVQELVRDVISVRSAGRREVRVRSPGNELRTLELTVRPLPDLPCCAGLLLADAADITERNAKASALASARAQQQAVLDCLLDPLLIIDAEGVILSASQAAKRVLGYKPEELVGASISMLMPEPFRSTHHIYLRGHLRTGRTTILGRRREVEAVRKDGTLIPIELSVARAALPPEDAPVFVGLLRDVTEDRRARAELLERDRRVRRMLETSHLLAVMLDAKGRVTFCNDAVLRLSGWQRPEMLGADWADHCISDEDRARFRAAFKRAIATGKITSPLETHLMSRSGAQRLIQWNNSLLEGPGGGVIGVTSIGVDVTDQHRVEADLRDHQEQLAALVQKRTAELEESHEQLRIADRLASIGTLAAGLGHDMSNVLLPTFCRLDVVEAAMTDPRLRKEVQGIRRSLDHLRKLGEGLRLLSFDPAEDTGAANGLDLNAWWNEVESLIARAAPRNIVLTVMIQPHLPPIAAPAHRLTQAVLNLVVNAADAVRPGGHIWLTAESLPGEGKVEIAIRDDGMGMSAKVQRRCLDPFFTTKKRGLGTGLGLTLAHAVTRSTGGRLTIESVPGSGTTVRMFFPILVPIRPEDTVVASVSIENRRSAAFVGSLLTAANVRLAAPGAQPDATSRIWVAEDTPQMRAHARTFLARDERRRVVLIGKGRGARLRGLRCVPTMTEVEQLRQALAESIAEATGGSDDRARCDSYSVCR